MTGDGLFELALFFEDDAEIAMDPRVVRCDLERAAVAGGGLVELTLSPLRFPNAAQGFSEIGLYLDGPPIRIERVIDPSEGSVGISKAVEV